MTSSRDLVAAPPQQPRQIRVFVSSTFADMRAEREILARSAFPELRRRCEQRGIAFSAVDLRWGITDEEARSGRVLEICLDEVERCRPFFLGILGDRYGSCPRDLPPALVERLPWLAAYGDRSITEIEVRHGVLTVPGPGASGPNPNSASIYRVVRDPRPDDGAAAFDALEQELRSSGRCRVFGGVESPTQLDALVIEHLGELIDGLAPTDSATDPVERSTMAHWQCVLTALRPFVGRGSHWRALDRALVRGGGAVITGPEGSGKTALLAHWLANRFGGFATDRLLQLPFWRRLLGGGAEPAAAPRVWLYHLAGASTTACRATDLLRRWSALLARHLGVEPHEPSSLSDVMRDFAARLSTAARSAPVVLVVDGIDGLVTEPGAGGLAWLPNPLPDGVTLIAAGRAGDAVDRLLRRGCVPVRLGRLTLAERRSLLAAMLRERQARRLGTEHRDAIVNAPAAGRGRYLQVVCEELRTVGSHAELPAAVAAFAGARDDTALYDLALERLERSDRGYERALPRRVLSALVLARDGLEEGEMRRMSPEIRDDGTALSWSAFLGAASHLLVGRGSRLGPIDVPFAAAVAGRYLRMRTDEVECRQRIVDLYRDDPRGERALDELPWQLHALGRWTDLENLIAGPGWLAAAWRDRAVEVRGYVASIEAATGRSVADMVGGLLDGLTGDEPHAWPLAQLLRDGGATNEALGACRAVAEAAAANRHRLSLSARGAAVELALRLGDVEAAVHHVAAFERLAATAADPGLVARARMLRASVSCWRAGHGDLEAARDDIEVALAHYRATDDLAGELAARGELGRILHQLDASRAALAEFDAELRLSERLGDVVSQRLAHGHRGGALLALERFDEALGELAREQELCEAVGDKGAIAECLGNQAVALTEIGRYDDAMRVLDEVEALHLELDQPGGLALTYFRQAYLFGVKLQQPAHAIPIAERGIAFARGVGREQLRARLEALLARLITA